MGDLFGMLNALDETPNIRENYVRAPFGYPGSKASSLASILPRIPYRNTFVETHGGTGAVLLARNESPLEIFNDRNAGVVALYRCIRDKIKCDALVDRLGLILHSREEFIWCRDTWKNCEDDIERAARWYYMLAMSFNQSGRNFGRCIKGKAQMGPKLHNNLKLFFPLHQRLRNVQIENLDWRACFKDFDSKDTVYYVDPNYLHTTPGAYEHEMDYDDHLEMLERVFQLEGFVAVSHYEHPLYERYKWDAKFSWEVKTTVLGMAYTETNHLKGKEEDMQRKTAIECLYIKE